VQRDVVRSLQIWSAVAQRIGVPGEFATLEALTNLIFCVDAPQEQSSRAQRESARRACRQLAKAGSVELSPGAAFAARAPRACPESLGFPWEQQVTGADLPRIRR
jgi:hypothetical protein